LFLPEMPLLSSSEPSSSLPFVAFLTGFLIGLLGFFMGLTSSSDELPLIIKRYFFCKNDIYPSFLPSSSSSSSSSFSSDDSGSLSSYLFGFTGLEKIISQQAFLKSPFPPLTVFEEKTCSFWQE
jgi:hypothetical protein